MTFRVDRGLHNWREDIVQKVAKVLYSTVLFKNVVNARHLNEPSDIVRVDLLLNGPFGKVLSLNDLKFYSKFILSNLKLAVLAAIHG